MKSHSYFYVVVVLAFYVICSIYVYFRYFGGTFSAFYIHDEVSRLDRFYVFKNQSIHYLRKFPMKRLDEIRFQSEESVCIAIPTVRRKNYHLQILLSSLLHNSEFHDIGKYFQNVSFKIINFEPYDRNEDFEYVSSLLANSSLFDFKQITEEDMDSHLLHYHRKSSSPTEEKLVKYGYLNWERKETMDFIYTLNSCAGYDWVLLVEDDAYASTDLFQKLATSVFPKLKKLDETGVQWALTKLYVTDWWDGFQKYTLTVTICICCFITIYHFLIVLYLFKLRYFDSEETELQTFIVEEDEKSEINFEQPEQISTVDTYSWIFSLIIFIFICFIAISQVFMFLSMGNQNVNPRTPGISRIEEHTRPGTWSGTVAQVVNTRKIGDISRFLGNEIVRRTDSTFKNGDAAVDIMLIRYAEVSGHPFFLQIPSLFQHVGWGSSSFRKNRGFYNLKQSNSFRNGPFGYNLA